jgi:hypothetical protein
MPELDVVTAVSVFGRVCGARGGPLCRDSESDAGSERHASADEHGLASRFRFRDNVANAQTDARGDQGDRRAREDDGQRPPPRAPIDMLCGRRLLAYEWTEVLRLTNERRVAEL